MGGTLVPPKGPLDSYLLVGEGREGGLALGSSLGFVGAGLHSISNSGLSHVPKCVTGG